MPEPISSLLVTEKNKTHNISPWVWLFKIQADATQIMYLCGYPEVISHNGQSYLPFPIRVEAQRRSATGQLTEVEIRISNLSREIATFLEAGKVLDQPCALSAVNLAVANQEIHASVFTVLSASLQRVGAVLKCGQFNLFSAPFPANRYSRTRCRHIYGRAGCWYDLNLPNAIAGTNPLFNPTLCDLELETSNGCRVHGLNEAANGKPRLHPLFFGAKPDIPKGPARV